MAVAKGALTIFGAKKATTWGTPVLVGALDGVEIISESLGKQVASIEDDQIRGVPGQGEASNGNISVNGDVVTAARYEGLEPLIAQWFGTSPVPVTVDTTARRHEMRMANSVDGLFLTLAKQLSIPEVHEYATNKVTGWTLACRVGERALLTLRFAGFDQVINTSTGTNNNTTAASITFPANREFLQFRQLVVRSNDRTAGALAASDAICVESCEITADRNHKTDDYTTCTGDKIGEPSPNDFSSVSITLGFSKYTDGTGGNAAFYAKSLLKTSQKLDVVFTGDTLAGATTEKFKWAFFLPAVQFSDGAPNVSGPGVIPYTLTGVAAFTDTVPTGFPSGVTQQIALDLTSKRTTSALA